MQRRFHSSNFTAHDTIMQAEIERQLNSGQTTLYGRQYTYQRLKQVGIPVLRHRMFSILRELDPEGVASRRLHMQHKPRGGFSVPGPNFVWSIDGHHKLSMYGIEIYAGIDAYSR